MFGEQLLRFAERPLLCCAAAARTCARTCRGGSPAQVDENEIRYGAAFRVYESAAPAAARNRERVLFASSAVVSCVEVARRSSRGVRMRQEYADFCSAAVWV